MYIMHAAKTYCIFGRKGDDFCHIPLLLWPIPSLPLQCSQVPAGLQEQSWVGCSVGGGVLKAPVNRSFVTHHCLFSPFISITFFHWSQGGTCIVPRSLPVHPDARLSSFQQGRCIFCLAFLHRDNNTNTIVM